MSSRKSISKKTRFEVFKRDSFSCQYCGAKAPDVVLHCDHINPVSKGGDNDILNLITACEGCNQGKGARLLNDNSSLDRQRAQLEELNERRQQIEWMLEWRNELSSLTDDTVSKISDFWEQRSYGYLLNEQGRRKLATWIKRFDVDLLLKSIEDASDQYIVVDENGTGTVESVNMAFDMIPRIAGGKLQQQNKPWMRDIYYVRAILRNRLSYVNERQAVALMEEAVACFVDHEWLCSLAKSVHSWSQFRDAVQRFIDEVQE